MITGITVRNLGCFDDRDYKTTFKKLNVMVGTNNSGKSTIFKGLNFVRWLSINGNMSWNTNYYRLQSFRDSVYGHDLNKKITIDIEYNDGANNGLVVINANGLERIDFRRNRQNYANIHHPEHQNILKKIWYFSPNIEPITYRENVGTSGDELQPLTQSGRDIKQFLVERWTDQDPKWSLAQEWFQKIDPQLTLFKSPLYGSQVSLETERNDGNITVSVNLSLQGSGIQNIATIIAGIIFSPAESTIIIEEPENYLNSRSIEILVDLFNFAVNELDKQIIIVTHSWEILNAYCSDIGEGTNRGNNHEKANPADFKLIVINEELGNTKIQDYDLTGKRYTDVRQYFKDLWG